MEEGQGPNNTYTAGKVPGQAQMRREWDDNMQNQSYGVQSQGQNTNFLQETGTHVKTMAQGAADVSMGAAQGAVSLARGAAMGAANIAQGATDAVKSTLGMNNPGTGTTTNPAAANLSGGSYPNIPPGSTYPGNINIDMEGLNYPSNTINMDRSTNPSNAGNPTDTYNPNNPNTGI